MSKLVRYIAVVLILLMFVTVTSCRKNSADSEPGFVDTTEDESEIGDTDDTKDSDSNYEESANGADNGNASQKQAYYAEDEDGNVVSTVLDQYIDKEYHLNSEYSTTGDYYVSEKDQGLAKSERRATEQSKYDFDKNPLINRDRVPNKTALPSFDIDDTGFVRSGTKLSSLRGHSLTFFTADNFAAWSYRSENGQLIDEWEWFKLLRGELGLDIKYTVKQHSASTQAALQAMNAGKACDIIYSNHVVFPSALCISLDITELININNLGSSPGVCKKTMDLCKWGNTLRLVSPIGCVDVLWYNQTLAQELGLSDPHVMWEKGVWNWDSFKNFLLSAPRVTKTGQKLTAFVEWSHNASYIWPSTNGCVYIKIDAQNSVPAVLTAWDNPKTLEAWEFITGVHNSVEFGSDANGGGMEEAHLGLYEGTTLMSATMYTQVYRDTEYSKNIRINWVPYPRSNNEFGQDICQYYGFGMMLPEKTAREYNVDVALKFMELWATRFTESLFDNLNTFEYYNFNYKQRKQYFDFVTQNVVFGLAMNDFEGSPVVSDTNFFRAFYGSSEYNVKTEAAKASKLVQSYVEESMKFGR